MRFIFKVTKSVLCLERSVHCNVECMVVLYLALGFPSSSASSDQASLVLSVSTFLMPRVQVEGFVKHSFLLHLVLL